MKYLYGILFLLSFNVNAQVNPGARITSMAGAGVSLSDVWSAQQNQAGMAAIKKITIALAFEKPFAGYDLSTQTAILVVPVNNHAFGLSLQRYGFNSYNEQRIAFSYARPFGKQFYAALSFNYHHLKIESYGSAQTYSVEAGVQYHFKNNLSIAAHLSNPGRSSFSEGSNTTIPSRVQLGASYLFSDKVLLAVALEKNFKDHFDTRLGLEYQIIELLSLRGGMSLEPFKQYAGFGLSYHQLNMDIAATAQPVLGYSPQIALSYEF